MRSFIFLLFCPIFFACQQEQGNIPTSAASICSVSNVAPKKSPPSATDVIFKSTDGGQTWQDVSTGLPEKFSARGIDVCGSEIFLCGSDLVYRSKAAATTLVWEKEYLLSNQAVASLFSGKSGVYASSFEKGLLQELPGVGVWNPVHTVLKQHTVRSVFEHSDGSVLASCDNGIFKSADAGKTWKQVFTGDMMLNFAAANGVLICGGRGGVLRSTDGGEHWEWALKGDGVTKKVGIIEGRLVAITRNTRSEGPWESTPSPDGMANNLFSSADGGKTWQPLDTNLPSFRDVHDIEQVGGQLFCSCDTGIFRSADGGKTWTLVLPSPDETFFDLGVSGQTIFAVKAFDGC